MCHPAFGFPSDWDVWHSSSHWSTEETMLRYVDKIIIPYFEQCRKDFNLPPKQKGLVIFDVFKSHRCESVMNKLRENDICFIYVPASCTSELQPLDSDGGINAAFKRLMKEQFSNWYGEQVAKELEETGLVGARKVDLTLTTMKPLHARWIFSTFEKMKSDLGVKMNGWVKTGIDEVVERALGRID